MSEPLRCFGCQIHRAVQDGQYEKAIRLLTDLLDVVPEHAEARMERAKLCAVVGRWQNAIEDFQAVLAANPSDGEAHLNLASVYTLLNHYEAAADHFHYVGVWYRPCEPERARERRAYRN